MRRQIVIGLHDGGKVVMRADGPEEAIPFDGPGWLPCLEFPAEEAESPDSELVLPDAMPEGVHTLRSTPFTETAYAPDWSRVLIAGWETPPRRPHSCECHVRRTALICACMNALPRGEKAVPVHCSVLEAYRE